MTPPDRDQPEDRLEVDSFSEVELKAPSGFAARARGLNGVDNLMGLALSALLVVVGFVGAFGMLIAGRPFWQAAVACAACLLVASAIWVHRRRKRADPGVGGAALQEDARNDD